MASKESESSAQSDDYSKELTTLKGFLETWGAKQELLLRDTLNKIVAAALVDHEVPEVRELRGADTPVGAKINPQIFEGHQSENNPNLVFLAAQESNPEETPRVWSSQTSEPAIRNDRTAKKSERRKRFSMREKGFTQVWVNEKSSTLPHWMRDYYASLQRRLAEWSERLLESSTPAEGRLAWFIKGRIFEMFTSVVILINAVWIAVSTDQQVDAALRQSTPNTKLTATYEALFAGFYTLEVIGRIYCERMRFIVSPDWKWNLLDSFLVALALQDQIVTAVDQNSASQNFTFFRLIRVLKLLKTLRIIKILRMFKELRLIVNSIYGSMRSMLWACCLICIVTFTFGIFLTQGCSSYFQEHPDDSDQKTLLIFYWGSVSTSMGSLYLAVFGGENWRDMADTLTAVGDGFRLAFFGFVGFFLLVIINTVTSLFVESAIEWAEKDQDALIRAEVDRKYEYVNKLKDVFRRMDEDGSGVISYPELVQSLNNPEILAFFSSLDLDVHDAMAFFQEISLYGEEDVDITAFVVNCMKLRGAARSIDLLGFIGAQRAISNALMVELEDLAVKVGALQEKLPTAPSRRSRPTSTCSAPQTPLVAQTARFETPIRRPCELEVEPSSIAML